MDAVLNSLRSLIIDHMSASELLVQNAAAGALTVKIRDTSKFRDLDEIFLIAGSATGNNAEGAQIMHVGPPPATLPPWPPPGTPTWPANDGQTLTLMSPITRGFTMAEASYALKALAYMPLKRVQIGGMKVIPSFPTITLEPSGESNEWMTLRGTSHEYRVSIRTYVLDDNFEKTSLALTRMTEALRDILIDHIHPIIEGEDHYLTADLTTGGTVAQIADTSNFKATDFVYIRDSMAYEHYNDTMIKTVLDPNFMELRGPVDSDFLVSRQARLTRVRRYLYDTRPESISYGFAGQGGTFMRASEITWFGKEWLCHPGNVLT